MRYVVFAVLSDPKGIYYRVYNVTLGKLYSTHKGIGAEKLAQRTADKMNQEPTAA